MHYIPPYSQLKNSLSITSDQGEVIAGMKFDDLENFVRSMLFAVHVDEIWYRITYPDIDDAIRQGLIGSARQHFIRDGYFEGRRPFAMTVDEKWYLSTYEDIGAAVSIGTFTSAEEHFASHGYEEGRIPCKVI